MSKRHILQPEGFPVAMSFKKLFRSEYGLRHFWFWYVSRSCLNLPIPRKCFDLNSFQYVFSWFSKEFPIVQWFNNSCLVSIFSNRNYQHKTARVRFSSTILTSTPRANTWRCAAGIILTLSPTSTWYDEDDSTKSWTTPCCPSSSLRCKEPRELRSSASGPGMKKHVSQVHS